jgi:hypothetical protein
MEDDLKLLKVEYLHNHWSDLPQIFYLSRVNQTEIEYCLKWRRPRKEDNLKNIEYTISQQTLIRSPQILNLSLGDQTKIENCLKWRQPSWKKKKWKWSISATSYLILLEFEVHPLEKIIGNPRGNLECGSAQPSLFHFFV